MRKAIIVTIIIVLAASAGAFYYLYRPLSNQAALETMLPGDTLAMVRVCELKKQIDRFRSNRMGQALGGIDWQNLLTAMGVAPYQRSEFVQVLEGLKTGVDSVWFDVLFGQDISLAVLDTDIDPGRLDAGDISPILEALVVVSRPSQPTKVLESLNSMLGTQLSVETEAYENWEINRLPVEGGGPSFYYALTDGLMISGFSIEPVKKCLRQSLDTSTCLLESDAYKKHCADLYIAGQTDMIGFSNVEGIYNVLLNAVDSSDGVDAGTNQVRMQIENMRGMESISFANYDDGGPLVNSRMIIGLDRANMSSYLNQMLSQAPEANPTFAFTPADALLYSWQNTFDPKLYWENARKDIPPEALEEFEQSFAAETGVALEDLLSAFGSEVGIMVNDISMDGMFPVPEFGLFAEVTRPDVIETIIGQIVSQSGMAIQQEVYGDTDIHYVMMPLGGNLSPAYTFSEGFLTLAINRALLKSMLEASDTGSLETHSNFKTFGKEMTSDNNSVFYLSTEGLIEKAREVMTWTINWMAMMEPDEAENMQQVMSLGVEPLLDGFSMVKAIGSYSTIEEDKAVSEIRILLDRTS